MRKKLLIGLLWFAVLGALPGCTYTDEEGKQQTIDFDFNHHVQFQRMPETAVDGVATSSLDSADACLKSIPVSTLVFLYGTDVGSAVNARPAPSFDQWYDPPITAKVGESVRVLAQEDEWYQARWVMHNNTVLTSYFHCSVLKDPNDD